MKTERTQKLILYLEQQLVVLKKSAMLLDSSYKKCLQIGIKQDYSVNEFESFDALTSRFARASDMLIQKIFATLDALNLEEKGSTLDRIHRAESRGCITSADAVKEIREIRNEIAHEYVINDLSDLFTDVLHFSPILLSSIETTEKYCLRFFTEH